MSSVDTYNLDQSNISLFGRVNSLLNSLPNNILDLSKLKTFADNKIDVVEMMISLLDRVENTVGKEEKAGYQHFPIFPQCFPKPSS